MHSNVFLAAQCRRVWPTSWGFSRFLRSATRRPVPLSATKAVSSSSHVPCHRTIYRYVTLDYTLRSVVRHWPTQMSEWGWHLPRVGRVSWCHSGSRFLICRSWCSGGGRFRVEMRLALVSATSPFSSVVPPPHSVGGLSQRRPLPGESCGAKVDGRRPGPPCYWCCYSQLLMLLFPVTDVVIPSYWCCYSQLLMLLLPVTDLVTPSYWPCYS